MTWDDQALWHIVHDDGDEEDLEEHELADALQRLLSRPADGLQSLSGGFADYVNHSLPLKQRTSKKLLGAAAAKAELVMLHDEASKALSAAGSTWVGAKSNGDGGGGGHTPAGVVAAAARMRAAGAQLSRRRRPSRRARLFSSSSRPR